MASLKEATRHRLKLFCNGMSKKQVIEKIGYKGQLLQSSSPLGKLQIHFETALAYVGVIPGQNEATIANRQLEAAPKQVDRRRTGGSMP